MLKEINDNLSIIPLTLERNHFQLASLSMNQKQMLGVRFYAHFKKIKLDIGRVFPKRLRKLAFSFEDNLFFLKPLIKKT